MGKAEAEKKSRVVAMIPEVIGGAGFGWSFFADRGVRETVESIVVAVLLALLFRGFEGEAFMIPTGSMAPGLQGHHLDLACPQCGIQYRTGASGENNLVADANKIRITETFCPICAWRVELNRSKDPDHTANQGDRILVNKYIYDFQEPRRFDVIVFKNPNNGKQNLIKRLVGLPGENLIISRGDVYTTDPEGGNRQIVRKPADKQLAMLQLVDDTSHRAKDLAEADWPESWKAWDNTVWETRREGKSVAFSADRSGDPTVAWLRYRHLKPHPGERGNVLKVPAWIRDFKGRLIGDHYGYNESKDDRMLFDRNGRSFTPQPRRPDLDALFSPSNHSPANHWVGDLAIEAAFQSPSGQGKVFLDLVEGGAHFQCQLDLENGQGALSCDHPSVRFVDDGGQPFSGPIQFDSPVRGKGPFVVTFCNADDRLFLWVNHRPVRLPASSFARSGEMYPTQTESDPGDGQPAGIGIAGGTIAVNRLRVLRDVYYVSAIGDNSGNIQNETGFPESDIADIHRSPEKWQTVAGKALFDASLREGKPMFPIPEGCYFPMGDNSPESKDARIWEPPHFFVRELLIGRAMLVYWPHTKNRPFPYTPNFEQMRPIR